MNRCVTEVSEKEERKMGQKNSWREYGYGFLKTYKRDQAIDSGSIRKPKSDKYKKTTHKHIIVKSMKNKEKQQNHKIGYKKGKQTRLMGSIIKLIIDFSIKAIAARTQ